ERLPRICPRFAAVSQAASRQSAKYFGSRLALYRLLRGSLDRLRFGNAQINLALLSPCTTLRKRLDRRRLGKNQTSFVFALTLHFTARFAAV
ncbi:MAG: hypothetical protein K2P46_02400, partial [Alistipes sp.]|nr:hypothetical protein [Alistipes sp.]